MEIVEFVFLLSVGVDRGVDLLVGERQGMVLRQRYVIIDRDVKNETVFLVFFIRGVRE
jgi:hypothetical protein